MIPYILHVALLLSVCLLFYKVLLQKETFYRLNRIVLAFCLVLSFALPLIPIPQQWAFRDSTKVNEVNSTELTTNPQAISVFQNEPVKRQQALKAGTPLPKAATVPTVAPILQRAVKWLFYIYWIGVISFSLNLLLQLIVLLYQAYTKPAIRDGRFRIVELSGDKAPCSFGNNIFINPEKYDWDTYSQILLHEKIHIQQRHSIDILLAELVLVLQWFNPFAWLYRKELENNLEFLTDDAVLGHLEVERSSYQLSLLKVSTPHLSLGITTNYNQSLLKKRIVMMNSKKSNIHTMWKYFFLVPLLGGLMCVLNNPVAYSQDVKVRPEVTNNINHNWADPSEGNWFATIKSDKINIEFKGDDDEHNWSSSTDFMLSEFSDLPKDQKGEFTLKREAGSIVFTGKFDGDQGYGHYKFTADKGYTDYMKGQGVGDMENRDAFTFFIINIKKDYVEMLQRNGYKNISKNNIIPMAALKVDEPFIKMWKQNGYPDLSPNQLVSGKALEIDEAYINEIHKAGYTDLSFNELISFKAQHITGDYINSLHKAKLKDGKSAGEDDLPPANQISAYKAMAIDSAYVNSFRDAGYTDIPYHELTALKSMNVTAEYIKGLEALGYKDVPVHSLLAMKSLKIDADFIKTFQDAGYKNIPVNDLITLKSLHITPEYIKSFEAVGYKDINIRNVIPLKSLGITPDYVNGFKKIGFTDIPLGELPALKSMGITPEYIASMQEKGFKSTNIRKYIQLKSAFDNNN